MAKITREPQKIFGGGLTPSNNIAVFGSLKAGSPAYSGDPSTIQSSAWDNGWGAAVVANQAPALQDMNAFMYVDSYQLAYLLQTGMAEWEATTTYYIGSWAQDGLGTPYVSLTDTNLNNALTDATKWRKAILVGPNAALNYGITSSVAASALTINLVNNAAVAASTISPALFSMRSSTATIGAFTTRAVTSALSLVVPSGATLGTASGVDYYLYLYVIDNAGTLELAVSGTQYGDASLVTTTAISGSSTSISTIYSTAARTSVPIKLISQVKVNETTAGTWASVPSEQSLGTSFPTVDRYQFKGLSADVNVTGLVSDLTFSKLTIGKTYCVTFNCQMYVSSNTGGFVNLTINHNSVDLVSTTYRQVNSIAGETQYIPGSMRYTFVAAATTVALKVAGLSGTAGSTLISNIVGGSTYATYGTLEELNNYAVTTAWT